MRRIRALYGAGPVHLVAMAICYPIALYAALRLLAVQPRATAGWFIGAAVGHDLLLLPAYVLLDSALVATWRRRPTLGGRTWLNHVRWPVAISLLLLLVFAPEIFGIDHTVYERASGLAPVGYLGRWGEVSATLFALSALAFAVRLAVPRRARAAGSRQPLPSRAEQ